MYLNRLLVYAYNILASHPLRKTLDEVMMRFGSMDDNDPGGSFAHTRNRPENRPRANSNEEYYTLPSFLTSGRVHNRSVAYNDSSAEQGPSGSNDVEGAAEDPGVRRESGRARSSGVRQSDVKRISNASGDAKAPALLTRNGSTVKLPGGRRRSLAMLTKSASRRISLQTVVMQLKGEHIKDLFWLSKPEIYFETVRFFIMLIALYISLWIVDYSSAMVDSGWKALAIVPGILSAINYLYVVKTAALLKAMYNLDFEAADKVFKQTDGSRLLEKTIREKLIKKLEAIKCASSDLKTKAYELFSEIDYDNSGVLDRREFSIYLSRLGIALNRKQWNETFRNIDIDASESISFQEFFVFLYPEHKESIRFERQRLNTIHMRVDQHTNLLNKSNSRLLNFRSSRKGSEGGGEGEGEGEGAGEVFSPSGRLAGTVSSSELAANHSNQNSGEKRTMIKSQAENGNNTEGDGSFIVEDNRTEVASATPMIARNFSSEALLARSRRSSSSSSSSSSSPSSGDEQCGIHPINDEKPDSE